MAIDGAVMMNHVEYLIIDKDSVLCDEEGLPIMVQGAMLDEAVSLGFGEVHNGHASQLTPSNTFAISKDAAIKANLIHAYGDKYDTSTHKSLAFLGYRSAVNALDDSLAHTISRAIQLILWQQDHQFCSRCGGRTHRHQSEHTMMCQRCRHRAYPRVQPCIITAITRIHPTTAKRQILLALHHRHGDTGMYGLIAGFVEVGESIESAVHREVMEEVGLSVSNLRYHSSQPWPYPTNLMLGFIADYAGGEIHPQADEIKEARFFDVDDLPLTPKAGTIAHTLIQSVIHLPT